MNNLLLHRLKNPEKPGNLDLLALYANYKQATDGDADGNRPSMTDFIARAKYDAWAHWQEPSLKQRQQKYIELVKFVWQSKIQGLKPKTQTHKIPHRKARHSHACFFVNSYIRTALAHQLTP